MGRRPIQHPLQERILVSDWRSVPVIFDIGLASRILGKNNESIRKMISSGDIPAIKCGEEWRIRKDKLMDYLGFLPWEIERFGFGITERSVSV